MVTVVNELGSLHLELEHNDSEFIGPEVLESLAREVIVINGDWAVDHFNYVTVISPYEAELSPGQTELYELLLTLQSSSVYCSTTLGKLAATLGIGVTPTLERLANLKSLGAISGSIPK